MTVVSDIQTEPPPDRALFIGARLFVAADAFFFLGFLFAYLYLRALNSNGLWHPPHIHPSGVRHPGRRHRLSLPRKRPLNGP